MKNTKKILSLLLAMLILCQGLVLVSAVESSVRRTEAPEWTYDNSMLVKINTEESKIFTPEDFPDMNCIQVLTTEKLRTETGYSYELMLIFDTAEGFDWQSTADALRASRTVNETKRNIYAKDFATADTGIWLNIEEEEIYLAVNESVDIYVESIVYPRAIWEDYLGVIFEVDPLVVDPSILEPNGLSEYGFEYVCKFADTDYYENDYYVNVVYPETVHSDMYFAYCESKSKCVDMAILMNTIPGIVSYYYYTEQIHTGSPETEFWENSNEDVATVNLSGGEPNWSLDFLVNQTATITGKSVGETSITVTRKDGTTISTIRRITVYDPKDVNFDGVANSLDAAQVLKYDAELVDESALHNYYGNTAGDVNFDGEINSLDAALILKYDAGLE